MSAPIKVELHSPWHAVKTILKLRDKHIIIPEKAQSLIESTLRFPENCIDNLNELSEELTNFILKGKE